MKELVFQSLFLWNALVEAERSEADLRLLLVSILVFMECSRRVSAAGRRSSFPSSFNPCFYGMLS